MLINLSKKLLVFICFLLAPAPFLIAQHCPQSGLLGWVKNKKIVQESSTYESAEDIYALFLLLPEWKKAREVRLEVQIDNNKATFLNYKLLSLANIPGLKDYAFLLKPLPFYLLPISPNEAWNSLEDKETFSTCLTHIFVEKAPIMVGYHLEAAGARGCFHIDFSKSWGKFQSIKGNSADSKEKFDRIQALKIEIAKLEADSSQAEAFLISLDENLNRVQTSLSQQKSNTQNLTSEEKNTLLELFNKSDSIGFAVNEAYRSNSNDEIMKVAILTAEFEKRKEQLKSMPGYQKLENNLQQYQNKSAQKFGYLRSQKELVYSLEMMNKELLKLRAELALLQKK